MPPCASLAAATPGSPLTMATQPPTNLPARPPAWPAVQLFPGGLASSRLREVRFLGAWGPFGACLPGVLQRCTSLQGVALRCLPNAVGRWATTAQGSGGKGGAYN